MFFYCLLLLGKEVSAYGDKGNPDQMHSAERPGGEVKPAEAIQEKSREQLGGNNGCGGFSCPQPGKAKGNPVNDEHAEGTAQPSVPGNFTKLRQAEAV